GAGLRHSIKSFPSKVPVITVASERLISGDSQAPIAWIDKGGHQFTECVSHNVSLDRRGTIALSVAVVLLFQPMFVAILLVGRIHADLNAIRSAILSAFEHGVLAGLARCNRGLSARCSAATNLRAATIAAPRSDVPRRTS